MMSTVFLLNRFIENECKGDSYDVKAIRMVEINLRCLIDDLVPQDHLED